LWAPDERRHERRARKLGGDREQTGEERDDVELREAEGAEHGGERNGSDDERATDV